MAEITYTMRAGLWEPRTTVRRTVVVADIVRIEPIPPGTSAYEYGHRTLIVDNTVRRYHYATEMPNEIEALIKEASR